MSDNNQQTIKLSRSDGLTHDLVNLVQNVDVNAIIDETNRDSISAKEAEPVDTGKIEIRRSDGIGHNIFRFGKTSSSGSKKVLDSDLPKVTGRSASSDFASVIGLTKRFSSTGLLKSRSASTTTTETIIPRDLSPSIGSANSVRIVHFANTHNFLQTAGSGGPEGGWKGRSFYPHGDIMIHSGDFTSNGTEEEFQIFNLWLHSVRDIYHYRLVCLGSRDVKVHGNDFSKYRALLTNATHVFEHDEVNVLGIRIYGCPWHWAHKSNYTLRKSAPATTNPRFTDIPTDGGLDILVTHGPAQGRLDLTHDDIRWGNPDLKECILNSRPKVHLHGHVHESRGFMLPFGRFPLTVNSCMSDKDRTALYTTPHVIRAAPTNTSSNPESLSLSSSSSSSSSSTSLTGTGRQWNFQIASLEE